MQLKSPSKSGPCQTTTKDHTHTCWVSPKEIEFLKLKDSPAYKAWTLRACIFTVKLHTLLIDNVDLICNFTG